MWLTNRILRSRLSQSIDWGLICWSRSKVQFVHLFHLDILIGVNIGRNKDTTTAVEQDYTLGIEQFGCLADYLVINISSPNTPGLRALQGENELKQLLTSIRSVCNKIVCDNDKDSNKQRPLILLKVAPDLNENEIKSISNLIRQPATKIDGLIVSNTTIARSDKLINASRKETGGLSGRPLKEKALETLLQFRSHTQGQSDLNDSVHFHSRSISRSSSLDWSRRHRNGTRYRRTDESWCKSRAK